MLLLWSRFRIVKFAPVVSANDVTAALNVTPVLAAGVPIARFVATMSEPDRAYQALVDAGLRQIA